MTDTEIEPGTINGYRCDRALSAPEDSCGLHTYVVHVDGGVTPMFLACRAEGVDPSEAKCKGRAVSLMYPSQPPPEWVVDEVKWEWFRPTSAEFNALDEASREHVQKGGVLLRPLTDAGRQAIREAVAR
jgi:hypothetical protein